MFVALAALVAVGPAVGVADGVTAGPDVQTAPADATTVEERPGVAATELPDGPVGDANQDGQVDIGDAQAIAQNEIGATPPGFNPFLANVTREDGGPDIGDAQVIANYEVGATDPPATEILDFDPTDTIVAGDSLDGAVTVQNTGGLGAVQAVTYRVAETSSFDTVVYEESIDVVDLAPAAFPGNAADVSFTVGPDVAPGAYTHGLFSAGPLPDDGDNASVTAPLTVQAPAEASLSALDIAGQGANATITVGDTESIATTVTNVGDVPGSFDLTVSAGTESATTSTGSLAGGTSETVTVDGLTGGLSAGSYDVTVSAGNETLTGDLTVQEPPEPSLSPLDIAGQGTNATIVGGTDEPVSVTVTNVGDATGSFELSLSVGPESATESTGSLAGGATETVTFGAVTGGLSPGDYTVTVSAAADTVTGSLTVQDPAEGSLAGLDIAGQGTDAAITIGTEAGVAVEVTNTGAVAGSFDVSLAVGTKSLTESTAQLAAGATETVTFGAVTGDLPPGNFAVTVSTADDTVTGDLAIQQDPFVMMVDSTNLGDTADDEFEINTGSGTFNYSVSWEPVDSSGSGGSETGLTDDYTISFPGSGTYEVNITGQFPHLSHSGAFTFEANKIETVEQWGDIQWQSMASMFANGGNLGYSATDAPDLSDVQTTFRMFAGADAFDGNLSDWDTGSVTNMSAMFASANSFDGNVSTWDVSSVTDMSQLFQGATAFDGDLSDWDTSSVTDMTRLFRNAGSFTGGVSAWNTGSVTDMTRLFEGATSFEGDISGWDTGSVTDMTRLFTDAAAFSSDLPWDTSGVTDMTRLFEGATSFEGDISAWDTSGVTDMSRMFVEAESFDGDISGWNTSGVTDMTRMFRDATTFQQDISAWCVAQIGAKPTNFDLRAGFEGEDAKQPNWGESCSSALSGLDIAGQGTSASITEGESASVSVAVTNTGESGSVSVTLAIGPKSTTESTAELAPGETETVTFEGVADELAAGTYDVTVSTGQDTLSGDLSVLAEGSFTLSGTVRFDPPAQGVTVSLEHDGETLDTTQTGPDGSYSLSSSPPENATTLELVLNGVTATEVGTANDSVYDANITELVADAPGVDSVAAFLLNGTGSQTAPYEIETASDLQAMGTDLDAAYELVDDIDASPTQQWEETELPVDPEIIGNYDLGSLFQYEPVEQGSTLYADANGLQPIPPDSYEIAADGDVNITNSSAWDALGTFYDVVAGNGTALVAQGFKTVGTSFSEQFEGSFDGTDHEIEGLRIYRPLSVYAGLFGYLGDATVSNVSLSNATVTARSRSGVLAGQTRDATISNVSASGVLHGRGIEIGGLVGAAIDTNVTDSRAHVDVTVLGDSAGEVGGLFGLYGDGLGDEEMRNSYATGRVYAPNADAVGGLNGRLTGTAVVRQSYATGAVTGNSTAGGLVGGNDGAVRDSYATGNVTGGDKVGGLVGTNDGNYVSAGDIRRSYATGVVTGNSTVGGLAGGMDRDAGGEVYDSYWDVEATGQSAGFGESGDATDATGLDTGEMQGVTPAPGGANTMPALDFGGTWQTAVSPDDYPVLRALDSDDQLDHR